jgi:hypothetical protein
MPKYESFVAIVRYFHRNAPALGTSEVGTFYCPVATFLSCYTSTGQKQFQAIAN